MAYRVRVLARRDGRISQAYFIFSFLLVFTAITLLSHTPSFSSKYAAMVVDAHTGKVIHARNADKYRFPASLTKMMTLYMLFRELKKGTIAFDTKFTVTKYAASRPPSKLGLKPGQQITVANAIRALITKSANDVAATIGDNISGSEAKFAAEMTKVARSLGMKHTTFRNASGLPHPKQRTTARDMVTLSKHLFQDFPQYFHLFKTKYFAYRGKRYRNHNRLLFRVRGVEGIKTGYTRASGFNLATSYRRGKKHLIAVVMGGRTAGWRNARMQYLLRRYLSKAVAAKRKPKKIPLPAKNDIQITQAVQNEGRQSIRSPDVKILKVKSVDIETMQKLADRNNGNAVKAKHVATLNNQPPQKRVEQETVTADDNDTNNTQTADGPFHIQVGAFSDINNAQNRLDAVTNKAGSLLRGHPAVALKFNANNKTIVRARFAAFSKRKARNTCLRLKRRSINCIVIRAE